MIHAAEIVFVFSDGGLVEVIIVMALPLAIDSDRNKHIQLDTVDIYLFFCGMFQY